MTEKLISVISFIIRRLWKTFQLNVYRQANHKSADDNIT